MTGGSTRLGCLTAAGSARPAVRSAFVLVLLFAGLTAAQSAPTATAPPSAEELRKLIEAVDDSRTPAAEADGKLRRLELMLQGGLAGLDPRLVVQGGLAVGEARERKAAQAKDPVAKQEQTVAAVVAYTKAGSLAFTTADRVDDQQVAEQLLKLADKGFRRAIALEPKNLEAMFGAARANLKMNKPLVAIELYQDLYQKRRGTNKNEVVDPDLHAEMGTVYLQAGFAQQARKSCELARRQGRNTADLADMLASAYHSLGKYEDALREWNLAVRLSPTEPVYYSRFAGVQLELKNLGEANRVIKLGITQAEQRLKNAPDDRDMLTKLRECLDLLAKILRAGLAREPGNVALRLEYVDTLQRRLAADQKLALHEMLGALRTDPAAEGRGEAPLLERQIQIMQVLGHRNLRSTCEALLKIQPDNRVGRQALDGLVAASQPASAPAPRR